MKILDDVFVYQMKDNEELSWHGRVHSHKSHQYEIHYFLDGEGVFKNGSQSFTISSGRLFVCIPNQIHQIIASASHPVTYYAILVGITEIEEDTLGAFLMKLEQLPPMDIGTNYRFYFAEMKEKGLSDDESLNASACHQLFALLYQLKKGNPSGNKAAPSDNHILEKALRYMQKHIDDDVSLQEICEELRISQYYFIRLFGNKLTLSPMKYFKNLKAEKAGSLLSSTDKSVKEIAGILGYSSEFHFSRQFKSIKGTAPSEYRRNYLSIISNSK